MADRTIIQQNVADRLVGLDGTDEFIPGHGAGIDDLDPLRQVAAMDAADSLIGAVLPASDDEDSGDEALGASWRIRLDTAEAALDRIRASHVDDGFGHCVLCWESDGPMSKAHPAPLPCAVLRSIAGAEVSAG